MSLKVKMKIFNAWVVPVLTYEANTAVMTKIEEKKLKEL